MSVRLIPHSHISFHLSTVLLLPLFRAFLLHDHGQPQCPSSLTSVKTVFQKNFTLNNLSAHFSPYLHGFLAVSLSNLYDLSISIPSKKVNKSKEYFYLLIFPRHPIIEKGSTEIKYNRRLLTHSPMILTRTLFFRLPSNSP